MWQTQEDTNEVVVSQNSAGRDVWVSHKMLDVIYVICYNISLKYLAIYPKAPIVNIYHQLL